MPEFYMISAPKFFSEFFGARPRPSPCISYAYMVVTVQVGSNLVTVTVGKKTDVTLRELGGSMAPIWPTYYKDSPSIMVSK